VTVLIHGLNSLPEKVIYIRPTKEALLANKKFLLGVVASSAACK
jgi:hypothetical protein